MALVMLALPGAVFVYNGEELGLPNVDLPDEVLQDPVWERSGHEERGRDGCRVPMPWAGDRSPFEFSTNPNTWLPIPQEWVSLTVERQLSFDDSTLAFFRRAIELRRQHGGSGGTALDWQPGPAGTLAFRVDGSAVTCVLNTSAAPVDLPDGELLLASDPLVDGQLAPNTAAWLV
jgi:alpha-glucosidase